MDIHIRPMSPSDVDLGMYLREVAGWNQTESDWAALLQIEPRGCFVAAVADRSVATATAVNYEGRFGWIGMVIVDPAFRRQGIATRMVECAIEYLESEACPCQKLDATESGAKVYRKMGFEVEYQVERWYRRAAEGGRRFKTPKRGRSFMKVGGASGRRTEGPPFEAPRPLSAATLDVIADLDRTAFGASRLPLLRWYATNGCPAFVAEKEGAASGYVVGRVGSEAWQVGPLVGADSQPAEDLMIEFLNAVGERTLIADVVAHNGIAVDLLERFGFRRQRLLYRMFRGENAWPGRPEETICLAGFEYG